MTTLTTEQVKEMSPRGSRNKAHTALVKACLELLALRGVPAFQCNSGATMIGGRFVRFGSPGVADVIASLPQYIAYDLDKTHSILVGRALMLECKTGTGRQTPAQKAVQENWERAGGLYWLIRDVKELEERLT